MADMVKVHFRNGPFSRKWVQYAFTDTKPSDNDEGQMKTTVEEEETKFVGETYTDVWSRSDPDGYEGCYTRVWDHKAHMGHDMEISVS